MSLLPAARRGYAVIRYVDDSRLESLVLTADLAGLDRLLATAGVDARTTDGRTALMLAAGRDNLFVAAALLDRGANVGLSDVAGATALHHGARAGAEAVVEQLLAAGADLEARDNDGRTALWQGCAHNLPDSAIVDMLLRAGADRFARDRNGVCPEDML